MRKCILCGLEHESGCDKSKWDGVLGTKFNITAPPYIMSEPIVKEKEAPKEEERQHVAKKRGRPRKNA